MFTLESDDYARTYIALRTARVTAREYVWLSLTQRTLTWRGGITLVDDVQNPGDVQRACDDYFDAVEGPDEVTVAS